MASRSDNAAKAAGALIAVTSLILLLYKPLAPILIGEDPWLIAAVAVAIIITLSAVVIAIIRSRRRHLASRIKRR